MVTRIFKCFLLAVLILLAGASTGMTESKTLMMATTTSTDSTGLLNYLAPLYTKAVGVELKWTAVGTGKALALGQNCDVDVLLVHDPEAEQKFIANGFGVNRKEIMYNDFVLIGPAADPAAIKGKGTLEALKLIQAKGAVFASRGDESGTHAMEKALWKKTGADLMEKEAWYVQTGQGMLPTISIAEEYKGYTLTDRGTYYKYEAVKGSDLSLKILVEGDDILKNQYSVMALDPKHCPKSRYDLAMQFANWMAGPDGQKLIGDFKVNGKPLFTANGK